VHIEKPTNEKRTQYTIVLVCDFQSGLVSRIMDVYRFFEKPPNIILIRRGAPVPTDPRLSVRSEIIPLPTVTLESPGSRNRLSAIASAIGCFLYSIVLYLRICQGNADIRLVHAHFIFPQGLFGLFLARLFRVPLVVTAAGSDVNLMMRGSPILRAASLFALKHAHATIAVSRPLHRRLREFRIWNSIYLPNSIDVASVRSVNQSTCDGSVLFVGSMTENKRPFLILRAFERVLEQVPTATLLICGDGPLRGAVQEEIAKKRLQNQVKLLSKIDPQLLNDVRSRTCLFVLPSLFEGLSLALLEALAAGQLVIASRNESHASVLEHGETALLFEPENSEQLAQQILLGLSNKDMRCRISRSAKRLCETQFSNAIIGKQLEEFYNEVLAASGGRRHMMAT
jgi:glycosyltransferase involved in cell wall biosynthesis